MQSLARIFKALGDENRLQILEMLMKEGESCACVLLPSLNISQPTLSHHLKILSDAELISCRRDGKSIYYKVNVEAAEKMVEGFTQVVENLTKAEGQLNPKNPEGCCCSDGNCC